jgi:hypothetical protein
MSRLISTGVVVAALLAVMTPAPAGAITNDKLAYLTLSGPVQVPGTTLNAGTYRFRLTNAETSRNTLQILSNDGSVLYAMFNTIPDRRASITDEAILSFRETPAGVPAAARSLFYGGEEIGYEFVYPKGGPNMIPEVVPQPEITYRTVPASAPEPIAEPEPELVPEPVVEPEPVPEQAAPPAELPRTATPLPLVAVGGFITLLAGLGIGLARRLVA